MKCPHTACVLRFSGVSMAIAKRLTDSTALIYLAPICKLCSLFLPFAPAAKASRKASFTVQTVHATRVMSSCLLLSGSAICLMEQQQASNARQDAQAGRARSSRHSAKRCYSASRFGLQS
eukprot:2237083-Pleurochrysis_carterae.AAC.1